MSGTSSSNQTQSSSLAPYSPASSTITGLLGSAGNLATSAGTLNGGQSAALGTITANANATPSNVGAINTGVTGLLNGGGANNNNGAISKNLTTAQNGILGTTASGANIGANSALQPQLSTIANDVTNQVDGQFAAAGRDGSPGNSQALARGIAQGEAPVIANQYNTDTANALGAAGTLYNAGNTTYGMLNANQNQANTNFTNGIGAAANGVTAENAAPSAALTAASAQFGIPASQLQTLLGTVSPVAQAFGTQNGTASGTQTMSQAQQFALLASGLGSLMPKGPVSFGGTQNFGAG